MLFPKYLVLNKKYGVENKSKFMLYYKEWVESKKRSNKATIELAKQPENYKNKPESTLCKFEQQPIEEEKEKKVLPLNQNKESCQPQRTFLKAIFQMVAKRQKREEKKKRFAAAIELNH